jgi:hypothetical protein
MIFRVTHYDKLHRVVYELFLASIVFPEFTLVYVRKEST